MTYETDDAHAPDAPFNLPSTSCNENVLRAVIKSIVIAWTNDTNAVAGGKADTSASVGVDREAGRSGRRAKRIQRSPLFLAESVMALGKRSPGRISDTTGAPRVV